MECTFVYCACVMECTFVLPKCEEALHKTCAKHCLIHCTRTIRKSPNLLRAANQLRYNDFIFRDLNITMMKGPEIILTNYGHYFQSINMSAMPRQNNLFLKVNGT
jgi:hypothetical protein